MIWIGLFHLLGETCIAIRLTRYTIGRDPLGHFNWEP